MNLCKLKFIVLKNYLILTFGFVFNFSSVIFKQKPFMEQKPYPKFP